MGMDLENSILEALGSIMSGSDGPQNEQRGYIFFVGYAYDGHGPGKQHFRCSGGYHVRQRWPPKLVTWLNFFLWAMLMMGMDLENSILDALGGFMSGSDGPQNVERC